MPKWDTSLTPSSSGWDTSITPQKSFGWDKTLTPEPEEKSGLIRRAVGDTAIGLAKGVAKLPQIVTGLADIPTGGRVGKAIEEATGYSGKAVDKALDPYLSPETRAASRKVGEAKGFFNTIGTALANPSSIVQSTAESIPSMLAGGMLGKAVLKGAGLMSKTAAYEAEALAASRAAAAAKTPFVATSAMKTLAPQVIKEAAVASGVGEGAVMAGQGVENMREQSADGLVTPSQALAGVGIGLAGGLIGAKSSQLAGRLGIIDIDSAISGGAAGMSARAALAQGTADGAAADAAKRLTVKEALRKIGQGTFTEGVLEEMPQSTIETIFQNISSNKPWDQGVANAAGMGLVTGGFMGGGMNAAGSGNRLLSRALADRKEDQLIEEFDRRAREREEVLANQTPNQAVIESLSPIDENGEINSLSSALQQNPLVEIPPDKEDHKPLLDATKERLSNPDTQNYNDIRATLEEKLATADDKDAPKLYKAIEGVNKQEVKDEEAFAKSEMAVAEAANDVTTEQAKFVDKNKAITEKLKALDAELAEVDKAPRVEAGKETKAEARERIAVKRESLQGDLAVAQMKLDDANATHQGAIDNHAVVQDAAAAMSAPARQEQAGQTLDFMGLQQTYESLAPHVRAFADKAIKVSKDVVDYVKRMVSKYGPKIAETARQIWEYIKGAASQAVSTVSSERGSLNNIPFGAGGNEGINIHTKSNDELGRALTNPISGSKKDKKSYFDVESEYKKIQSKKTRPDLPFDEALKYDKNLMYKLQRQKFAQNPELVDEITRRGGVEFLEKSEHTIGVKGSRWEGKGRDSNFMQVLIAAYEKEVGEKNKKPTSVNAPQAPITNKPIPTPAPNTATPVAMTGNPSIPVFKNHPAKGYAGRTKVNASADATIALATDFTSRGEELTKETVEKQGKGYIPVDATTLDVTPEKVASIVKGLNDAKASTLNIAGNGIYTMKGTHTQADVDQYTYELLKTVLSHPDLAQPITQIQSGGQTGFDEAGIKAAMKLGIPSKIIAPANWAFRNVHGVDVKDNRSAFVSRFGKGFEESLPVNTPMKNMIANESTPKPNTMWGWRVTPEGKWKDIQLKTVDAKHNVGNPFTVKKGMYPGEASDLFIAWLNGDEKAKFMAEKEESGRGFSKGDTTARRDWINAQINSGAWNNMSFMYHQQAKQQQDNGGEYISHIDKLKKLIAQRNSKSETLVEEENVPEQISQAPKQEQVAQEAPPTVVHAEPLQYYYNDKVDYETFDKNIDSGRPIEFFGFGKKEFYVHLNKTGNQWVVSRSDGKLVPGSEGDNRNVAIRKAAQILADNMEKLKPPTTKVESGTETPVKTASQIRDEEQYALMDRLKKEYLHPKTSNDRKLEIVKTASEIYFSTRPLVGPPEPAPASKQNKQSKLLAKAFDPSVPREERIIAYKELHSLLGVKPVRVSSSPNPAEPRNYIPTRNFYQTIDDDAKTEDANRAANSKKAIEQGFTQMREKLSDEEVTQLDEEESLLQPEPIFDMIESDEELDEGEGKPPAKRYLDEEGNDVDTNEFGLEIVDSLEGDPIKYVKRSINRIINIVDKDIKALRESGKNVPAKGTPEYEYLVSEATKKYEYFTKKDIARFTSQALGNTNLLGDYPTKEEKAKLKDTIETALSRVQEAGYDISSFVRSMFFTSEGGVHTLATTPELPTKFFNMLDAIEVASVKPESIIKPAPQEEATTRTPNKAQQRAINHVDGPMLVLAPVGSGKTTTIINRINDLIENGVNPQLITAITFTNKASEEMSSRLGENSGVFTSTFHKLGKDIIANFARTAGETEEFVYRFGFTEDNFREDGSLIISVKSQDQFNSDIKFYVDAINAPIAERNKDNASGTLEKELDSSVIAAKIEAIKNSGTTVAQYKDSQDHDLDVAYVYEQYQTGLEAAGEIDFSDMILKVVDTLENDSVMRAEINSQIQYLMVDEYQDINPLQQRLIDLLVDERKNVFAVGDDNQSIYGWRGADISNIRNFNKNYKNAKVVKLTENYRSTPEILDVAYKLISNNEGNLQGAVQATRAPGEEPRLVVFENESQEAIYIAQQIKDAVDMGIPVEDIAVLSRTNAQNKLIYAELLGHGVVGANLMTFHTSKGKEFGTVFVTTAPINALVNTNELLEEERRNLYVAITRAKNQLVLTHSYQRSSNGETRVMVPSGFLYEMGLLEKESHPAKDSIQDRAKAGEDVVLPSPARLNLIEGMKNAPILYDKKGMPRPTLLAPAKDHELERDAYKGTDLRITPEDSLNVAYSKMLQSVSEASTVWGFTEKEVVQVIDKAFKDTQNEDGAYKSNQQKREEANAKVSKENKTGLPAHKREVAAMFERVRKNVQYKNMLKLVPIYKKASEVIEPIVKAITDLIYLDGYYKNRVTIDKSKDDIAQEKANAAAKGKEWSGMESRSAEKFLANKRNILASLQNAYEFDEKSAVAAKLKAQEAKENRERLGLKPTKGDLEVGFEKPSFREAMSQFTDQEIDSLITILLNENSVHIPGQFVVEDVPFNEEGHIEFRGDLYQNLPLIDDQRPDQHGQESIHRKVVPAVQLKNANQTIGTGNIRSQEPIGNDPDGLGIRNHVYELGQTYINRPVSYVETFNMSLPTYHEAALKIAIQNEKDGSNPEFASYIVTSRTTGKLSEIMTSLSSYFAMEKEMKALQEQLWRLRPTTGKTSAFISVEKKISELNKKMAAINESLPETVAMAVSVVRNEHNSIDVKGLDTLNANDVFRNEMTPAQRVSYVFETVRAIRDKRYMKARMLMIKRAFDLSHITDENKFESIAESFNSDIPSAQHITPADIFDYFLKSSSDFARLASILNTLKKEMREDAIAKAYSEKRKENSKDFVRFIATSRLTPKEVVMYERMLEGTPVEAKGGVWTWRSVNGKREKVWQDMTLGSNVETYMGDIEPKLRIDKNGKQVDSEVQQKEDQKEAMLAAVRKEQLDLETPVKSYPNAPRKKGHWENGKFIKGEILDTQGRTQAERTAMSEQIAATPNIIEAINLIAKTNPSVKSLFDVIEKESQIPTPTVVTDRANKTVALIPYEDTLDLKTKNKLLDVQSLENQINSRLASGQSLKIIMSDLSRQEDAKALSKKNEPSKFNKTVSETETQRLDREESERTQKETEWQAKIDDIIAQEIGNTLTDKGLSSIADQATIKPTNELTDDEDRIESKYVGVKVVTIKNSIVRSLLTKIAGIFGADLITVTANRTFGGRYIPAGIDGRPKIVVNIKSKQSISRIFAHEMFHHILNKISEKAYQRFIDAIHESVTESAWNDAVDRIYAQQNASRGLFTRPSYNMKGGIKVTTIFHNDKTGKRVEKNNVTADFLKSNEDLNSMSKSERDDIENELYSELFAEAIHTKAFWDALATSAEGKSIGIKILAKLASVSTSVINELKKLNHDDWNQSYVSNMFKDMHEVNKLLAGVATDALVRDKTEGKRGIYGLRNDKERSFVGVAELKEGEKYITSEYTKASEGETGYAGMRTAINSWWNALLDLINVIKPDSWFADYRISDPVKMRIMTALLHAGNAEAQLAELKVTQQFGNDVFSNLEADQAKFEKFMDDISRNHKPAAYNALSDKQKGALQAMKSITDKLHEELVRVGLLEPGQKNPHHYGMSIKWFKSGIPLSDEFTAAIMDDLSGLAKGDQFLLSQAKSLTTQQIREQYGLTYKTQNPVAMFKKYVEDATALIALQDTIKKLENTSIDGKTLMIRDINGKSAAYKGYVAVTDKAFEIRKAFEKGYKIKLNEVLHESEEHDGETLPEEYVADENGNDIVYRTEAAAAEYIKTMSEEGKSRAEIEEIQKPDHAKDVAYYNMHVETRYTSPMKDVPPYKLDPVSGFNATADGEMISKHTDQVHQEHLARIPLMNLKQLQEAFKKKLANIKVTKLRLEHAINDKQSSIMSNQDDDKIEHLHALLEYQKIEGRLIRGTIKEYNMEVVADARQQHDGQEHPIERVHWKREKKAFQTSPDKNDAERISREHPVRDDQRVNAVPQWVDSPTVTESTLYFDPEIAKLMRVILSKDHFRNSKIGSTALTIKNSLTMLELSLSGFHWMTIGQEAVSSAVSLARNEKGWGKLKAFHPGHVFNNAREMKMFFERVLTDEAYATTKEAKDKLKSFLGTDKVEAAEIWRMFTGHGGAFVPDSTLRGGVQDWGVAHQSKEGKLNFDAAWHSVKKTHEMIHGNTDNKLVAVMKEIAFHTLVTPTAFLMEETIPRVKFAAFAKEYATRIVDETKRLKRDLTVGEKEDIARDQMKFVEDRFGEVNWKNMWLHKTNKSLLQFFFRSFTWVAGSWKAMVKSGAEIGKWGFMNTENLVKWGWMSASNNGDYKFKDGVYHMTDKGYWGLSAVATHLATAAVISNLVKALFYASGGDDDEWQKDDESVSFMVRMLFPRINPYDNTKRLAFGSYPSEVFKHLSHAGIIGDDRALSKIWTGRLNGFIGSMWELGWMNETFEGVTIRDSDDSLAIQAYDVGKYMLSKFTPMSIGGFMKSLEGGEGVGSAAIRMAGFTNAPASTMRSSAANLAFQLSRQEYKGKKMTDEEMDLRNDIKRGMMKYVHGDKTDIQKMLSSGRISKRQYDIALTRYPIINGKTNPKYVDQLSQALNRLTVKSALKVFETMTPAEQLKHYPEMVKKINNMKVRKDTPLQQQKIYIDKWKEINHKGATN